MFLLLCERVYNIIDSKTIHVPVGYELGTSGSLVLSHSLHGSNLKVQDWHLFM